MATLSDLKEVKEALDAGLVSQAEYDDVKRGYLTAKKDALEASKEYQKKKFRAKEEAIEFQKRELLAEEESQKKELCAKEEFQKKELRAKEEALEIQKKGISECQKMELCARKEALETNKEFQKRELLAKEEFQKKVLRAKEETLDAHKDFQKRELIVKEAFQQTKADAELRVFALESIVKHGASIMSEEQKVDLIRDFAKMSGLDCSAKKYARASKRQRTLPSYLYLEEVGPDQNPTSKQRSNTQKWSEEEELTFIQAHREGKTFMEITAMLPGRSFEAVKGRWRDTKSGRTGSAALRAYVAECCKDE